MVTYLLVLCSITLTALTILITIGAAYLSLCVLFLVMEDYENTKSKIRNKLNRPNDR